MKTGTSDRARREVTWNDRDCLNASSSLLSRKWPPRVVETMDHFKTLKEQFVSTYKQITAYICMINVGMYGYSGNL